MSKGKEEDILQQTTFKDLVDWIGEGGGHTHPSFEIYQSNDGIRGIRTSSDISKGSLLIRLPLALSLYGDSSKSDIITSTSTQPSPWLECVTRLMIEKNKNKNETLFYPYFESLPKSSTEKTDSKEEEVFETLWNWSIEEIQDYLCGTILGTMALSDKSPMEEKEVKEKNKAKSRFEYCFEQRVLPYLQKKLSTTTTTTTTTVPSTGENKNEKTPTFDDFVWAAQCISTRGFHIMDTDEKNVTNTNKRSNNGPFLLPFIDLLNHDVSKKCTTLSLVSSSSSSLKNKRSQKDFVMIAERDIKAGEEIYHSYHSVGQKNNDDTSDSDDTSLTSAQFLQTFGFIPRQNIMDCCYSESKSGSGDLKKNLTFAMFSMKEIIDSCHFTVSSPFVRKILELPKESSSSEINDDEEEDIIYWDPIEAWDSKLSYLNGKEQTIIPKEFLTTDIDEIISCIVLLVLPQDAFQEMFLDNSSDAEILYAHRLFPGAERMRREQKEKDVENSSKKRKLNHDNNDNPNNNYDDEEDEELDEDPWLSCLLQQAIVNLIHTKCKTYSPTNNSNNTSISSTSSAEGSSTLNDASYSSKKETPQTIISEKIKSLKDMFVVADDEKDPVVCKTTSTRAISKTQNQRRIAGLTIQIEELKSLQVLLDHVLSWFSSSPSIIG